jgi:hypothetical protein
MMREPLRGIGDDIEPGTSDFLDRCRAEGLTAAVAGEAAWFGGAKRVAEPGCERSERRVRADVRSMSARTR